MKNIAPNHEKEISNIIEKMILLLKNFKELDNKNKYNYLSLFYRLRSRFNNLKYYCDNYYKCIGMSDIMADYIGVIEQKLNNFEYFSLKIEDLDQSIEYLISCMEKLITSNEKIN